MKWQGNAWQTAHADRHAKQSEVFYHIWPTESIPRRRLSHSRGDEQIKAVCPPFRGPTNTREKTLIGSMYLYGSVSSAFLRCHPGFRFNILCCDGVSSGLTPGIQCGRQTTGGNHAKSRA